jgi:hypothetical protein
VAIEGRLVRIALLVVRCEVPGGQLFTQIKDAVEGLAGVLGEPRPLRQLVDAQSLVEQKVEIAPRQQGGLHPTIFAEIAGRSRKTPNRRSVSSFEKAGDLG